MDFERLIEGLYTELLHPGDVAIDVGAHTGRHTIPMARAVGRDGSVLAFEPNLTAVEQLRSGLRTADLEHVRVHALALSDAAGRSEFFVAVDRPQESGLRPRTVFTGPTGVEQISVDVETLDSICGDGTSPVFIKIDVEGAELAVLRGAAQVLARSRPTVAFEFGLNSSAAFDASAVDMFEHWSGLDYTVVDILGHVLTRDEFLVSATEQRLWDYVAIPSGSSVPKIRGLLRRNARRSTSRVRRLAARVGRQVFPST